MRELAQEVAGEAQQRHELQHLLKVGLPLRLPLRLRAGAGQGAGPGVGQGPARVGERVTARADQLKLGDVHALERARQVAAQPARLDRLQHLALEAHAVQHQHAALRAQAH